MQLLISRRSKIKQLPGVDPRLNHHNRVENPILAAFNGGNFEIVLDPGNYLLLPFQNLREFPLLAGGGAVVPSLPPVELLHGESPQFLHLFVRCHVSDHHPSSDSEAVGRHEKGREEEGRRCECHRRESYQKP